MQVELYYEVMNDPCRPKSNQNGNVSEKYKIDDHRIPVPVSLQPTPINPEKIVSVERVSIQATKWNLDTKSIEYLKGLSPSMGSKAVAKCIPDQQLKSPKAPPASATFTTSNHAAAAVGYPHVVVVADSTLLRQKQVDQWNTRYAELVQFRKDHGHCLVPLRYEPNKSLSNWVKRQRYQYRIKKEGKHSTLTDLRQAALEKLGFVWDSHSSTWEERFQELSEFKEIFGHANVPKSYKKNQQLAIWVKSQRRHFRIHLQGKPSAMTEERMERLKSLGFEFNPRSLSIKGGEES